MNGVQFFNAHFGRYFLERPSGDAIRDARAVLHASHPLTTGATSRFTTGNVAAIAATRCVLRGRFDVNGPRLIGLDAATQYALLAQALLGWDGEPLMLLQFGKTLFDPANLLVSYDPRLVRVCTPNRAIDVNFERVCDETVDRSALNAMERSMRKMVRRLTKEADHAA